MPDFIPCTSAHKSLVLALDFGTTHSGVAYSVLEPGEVPKIHCITRFPGQENGDFKIPSVVCYADDGRLLSIGAEARRPDVDREPEEGLVTSVEWFKLYLCPPSLRPEGLGLPTLPPNKTIVSIVADFFAYLFKCARDYIQETHANGVRLWNSLGDRIDVVVSHPSGWEGEPQAKLREAAILAGLITDTPVGRARLHFITEGEASMHHFVNGDIAASLDIKDGSSVMVVDAGGGTVDLTTYKFITTEPITVEETAPPACILQGSNRVNARFHAYLRNKLRNSEFGGEDDIRGILEAFERSTKPTFKNPADRSFIRFGRKCDTDLSVDIRNGQLAIPGADLAELFQPSLDGIVAAIRDQAKMSTTPVNAVFLVGGFAVSPWLYTNLCDALKDDAIVVHRPDGYTQRSVPHGAVAFFLKKFATTRVARMTWGVRDDTSYCADNPEHYKRRDKVKKDAGGTKRLHDVFRTFISEGSRLAHNDVFRFTISKRSTILQELDAVHVVIVCYRGTHSEPYWMDEGPDAYWPLCTVRANTSGIHQYESDGIHGTYYMIIYDIVLTVDHTGLRAQIAWTEKGMEKRSDAEIIYEESEDYHTACDCQTIRIPSS